MTPETRNSAVLRSFVDYCEAHPEQRFWQALRNWSGYHFIGVSGSPSWMPTRWLDTFNWEGRRHDE